MKTINEYVNSLDTDQLKEYARGYLIYRTYDLMTEIRKIDNDIKRLRGVDFPESGQHIPRDDSRYLEIKRDFEEKGIFDLEYEKLYQDANKGQLSQRKVNDIIEKLIKETFGYD